MQYLVIDATGTLFIEDANYREVLHIYIPDLIKKLIEVCNKNNPHSEDHFVICKHTFVSDKKFGGNFYNLPKVFERCTKCGLEVWT